MRIFSPDRQHLNPKNYNNLFKLKEQRILSLVFDDGNADLKHAEGAYSSSVLNNLMQTNGFELLPDIDEDIFINEFLSFVLPLFYQSNGALSETPSVELLKSLYKEDYNNCKLAANFWLCYWQTKDLSTYDLILSFSGSRIYQKALSEIAAKCHKKFLTTEHLFTGNEFFIVENRTSPNHIPLLRNADAYNQDFAGALKILSKKNNKNTGLIKNKIFYYSKTHRKTVLLLAQVLNDYSLLENEALEPFNFCSIELYKKLIDKAQRDNVDLIIKLHPYESTKYHLNEDLTKNILHEYCCSKGFSHVTLVSNVDMTLLFEQADIVTTVCSQAGLESCLFGYKPVILGNAFYDKYGFTSNIDLSSLDSFSFADYDGSMNLDEYLRFTRFISYLLNYVVINHDDVVRLFAVLSDVTPEHFNAEEYDRKLQLLQSFLNPLSRKKQTVAPIVAKAANKKQAVVQTGDTSNSNGRTRQQRLRDKWRKDPIRYLKDSRHISLRVAGKILGHLRNR